MKYYLYNIIEKKYFKCYDKLDNGDFVSVKIILTDNMNDAKEFSEEREAWYYLYGEYGLDYTQRTYVVFSIYEKAINIIETRKENGRA